MGYGIARHFPVIACVTMLACACSQQPAPPAASGPAAAAASAPVPADAPTPGPTLAEWARGAQLFDDLGSYSRKITTGSAAAQAWFDQGLPHTHVALDDAIEQGHLFCNMLAGLPPRR